MSKQLKFVALAAGCAMLGGCMSDQAAKDLGTSLGEAFATPFNLLAQNINGAQNLTYAMVVFQRKNERWPEDYAELSAFVQQSDGYLFLNEYDMVDFSEQDDGELQVTFMPHGRTNQMSFVLYPQKSGDK